MVEVIARGAASDPYGPTGGERVIIRHQGHEAVLSFYRHGNRETWLLTGWKEYGPGDADGVNPNDTYARRPSGIQGGAAGPEQSIDPKPRQVKSKEDESEPDVLFQKAGEAPAWYSTLRRLIEQKMPAQAPPLQVRGLVANGGIKADELKWSGLDDWLARSKGPLAKARVLEFLDQNAVRVEEVVKGSPLHDDSKFGEYVLPGGHEYRELLLTLPRRSDEPLDLEDAAHEEHGRSFSHLTDKVSIHASAWEATAESDHCG